eukprot:6346173-Prymnesium_polylepis.2
MPSRADFLSPAVPSHHRYLPLPVLRPLTPSTPPARACHTAYHARDATLDSLVARAYHSSHAPTDPVCTAVYCPRSLHSLIAPPSRGISRTGSDPPTSRHSYVFALHVRARDATVLHAPITVRNNVCRRSRALAHQCATLTIAASIHSSTHAWYLRCASPLPLKAPAIASVVASHPPRRAAAPRRPPPVPWPLAACAPSPCAPHGPGPRRSFGLFYRLA